MQGIKNFNGSDASEMRGIDPDHAQRDLIDSIENNDFPKWALKIQVMTDDQAKSFRFNPFDLTKVWSQKDFPLIDVGTMELNEVPQNYFGMLNNLHSLLPMWLMVLVIHQIKCYKVAYYHILMHIAIV